MQLDELKSKTVRGWLPLSGEGKGSFACLVPYYSGVSPSNAISPQSTCSRRVSGHRRHQRNLDVHVRF